MVFTSPVWPPPIADKTYDSISIPEFMFEEKYGRHPLRQSQNPFTCGITGITYSALEMANRVELLSKGLARELGWFPNEGNEWKKVAGIFSLNTVDYMTVVYAVHRLSGIVTPVNPTSTSSQLEHQLRASGAKALFTCSPLMVKSFRAARAVGIQDDNIYVLDLPDRYSGNKKVPFITIAGLIRQGTRLPPLEPLNWKKGQGDQQAAFLCYTDGTSDYPKGVILSHSNVISNVTQLNDHHREFGDCNSERRTNLSLGLHPFSHVYGLVVMAMSSTWRGDGVIILPKFELDLLLNSIQQFTVDSLYIVPSMLTHILKNQRKCDMHDMSSVKTIFTGGASFDTEIAREIKRKYPSWDIRHSYGLTETSAVISYTPRNDIFLGSSGCLIPGVKIKLLSADGEEINEYDKPGELIVQSPSVMLGYFKDNPANKEIFINNSSNEGKWIRTGDEALIRKSEGGNEHLFITERIKEIIRVKDMQVTPTELEAHLLSHPFVVDCAVISIPNENVGEVPKAFIVKEPSLIQAPSYDLMMKGELCKYVEDHKDKYKWLEGGVEFVDFIPKSQDGKILRRLLKNRETNSRAKL